MNSLDENMDERGLKALSLAVRYGKDADLAFKAIALEEKRYPQDGRSYNQAGAEAICDECGKTFIAREAKQRFCSPACKNKYHHHKRHDVVHRPSPGKPILREFRCKNCGDLVRVTDRRDRRKKFCTQTCQDYYWKDRYLNDEQDSRGTKNKRRRKR